MQTENKYSLGQVILIDKPLDWTSFDVVNKMRFAIGKGPSGKRIKVGHAGTLDPLATGLVIVCTGKLTKSIDSFMSCDKEYVAELCLGATTPSFDAELPVDAEFDVAHIDQALIDEVLESFRGESWQVPPVFSAVSVDGKRAYKSARKGEHVEIPPRQIQISEIEQLSFSNYRLRLRIRCSKGTYIRALARDIGLKLGSGAYLTALRRTFIGEYSVEDALSIEEFVAQVSLNE
ncbi:MAG: hypothetical protein RIS47_2130 [Bacteroidota bacterium]|jgi:tRNA pseudouridine55 synthase